MLPTRRPPFCSWAVMSRLSRPWRSTRSMARTTTAISPGSSEVMARSKNTRLVAHIDCPGGGQVWVDGRTLYIGHMREPTGTSIVDIADPKRPVLVARVEVPVGWHSHKVRVANGI